MKTYNITWEECHSVNVKANTEDEAISIVHKCEHDTANESAEIVGDYEAIEMDICAICDHIQDDKGRCPCTNQNQK